MSAVVIISILLCGAYAVLMAHYLAGWLLQRRVQPLINLPVTTVSIIIPARNEAQNIGNCINAILAQDYPQHLFEIIVTDDFSEDGTAAAVRSFDSRHVKLIRLSDVITARESITAFKKLALGTGIAQSIGDLIITTDADCTMGNQWLRTIVSAYEQQEAKMIIAPVDFTTDNSAVQLFQSLDFMTMQGITAAANRLKLGYMANGANLAFSRAAFDAIGGYEGTTHIASGDDYLLLVKMGAHFSNGICYLKDRKAIVHTSPQPTWRALLNQRIRWASKSGKYKDDRLTVMLIIVYLFNVWLIALFCVGLFVSACLHLFIILLCIKIVLEIIFLLPVSRFFGKEKQLLLFPLLQPLHIVYIGLAGFLGYIGKYEWKGRSMS